MAIPENRIIFALLNKIVYDLLKYIWINNDFSGIIRIYDRNVIKIRQHNFVSIIIYTYKLLFLFSLEFIL